jgi:hypothetical protein
MGHYEALRGFWEVTGHTDLSLHCENKDMLVLSTWLQNQRRRQPSADRRKLLEALGVQFVSLIDQAWQDGFERLRTYMRTSNNELPAIGFTTEDGYALGNWVSNQRQAYSSAKISPERISKLELLGFVFNAEDAAFEAGLDELRLFKSQHGHANVPIAYVAKSGYKLGTWCGNVRSRMKKTPDPGRMNKLLELGFVQNPTAESWQRHFELCVDEVRRKGYVGSAAKAGTGEKIGAWLYRQMAKAKTADLNHDHYKKMIDAGLIRVHGPECGAASLSLT